LYSHLTGEDQCRATQRPATEVDSLLTAAGPSLFDPAPHLQAMTRPALWIYGGLDLSIPVARSVQHLTAIRDSLARPFTIVVIPNLNHSWIVGGGICQRTGPDWDDGQVIVPWFTTHVALSPSPS